MAGKTVKSREDFFIEINNTIVVQLKLVAANFSAVLTDLGLTKVPETGAPPAGRTDAGSGTEVALGLGCFPIRVYYKKGGKSRSATILCPPSKADTVFQALRGKAFAGGTISRVGPVRRRRYTMS
jgi:hypothetical protein